MHESSFLSLVQFPAPRCGLIDTFAAKRVRCERFLSVMLRVQDLRIAHLREHLSLRPLAPLVSNVTGEAANSTRIMEEDCLKQVEATIANDVPRPGSRFSLVGAAWFGP